MFANSEMTHICCATLSVVYQDAACSTKRPQVSQRLGEGKIESCSSKLSEQYASQLKGKFGKPSKTKERHVW